MRVISIDFIVGLPTTAARGSAWQYGEYPDFDCLMTVSCKASKRTLLIPGHSIYPAEDWGKVLMRQLLLSDWFTSNLWRGMWETLGTKLLMTAAYHPQADGLAERKNQTVEIALRYFIYEHPAEPWINCLTLLQWHLNASYSAPIKSSPHEQLFGFKPAGPLEALTPAAATGPPLCDTSVTPL